MKHLVLESKRTSNTHSERQICFWQKRNLSKNCFLLWFELEPILSFFISPEWKKFWTTQSDNFWRNKSLTFLTVACLIPILTETLFGSSEAFFEKLNSIVSSLGHFFENLLCNLFLDSRPLLTKQKLSDKFG